MFETKQKKATPKVVNVASVPQRSPFRYPGGKTWLIPVVRKWLKQSKDTKTLIEPFAGGGIVSLTAAFESLAEKIVMVELDGEVAAVWEVIINGDHNWLADKIYSFDLNPESANSVYFYILTHATQQIKRIVGLLFQHNRAFNHVRYLSFLTLQYR